MHNTPQFTSSLEWLTSTLRFFKNHFTVIMTLGLIAGLGRVTQLKGFGEVSGTAHLVLEVIIESARILLFIYVLGSASIPVGFKRIAGAFRKNAGRRQALLLPIQRFRSNWKEVLLNLFAFLAIAWIFNLFIDHLAYETCLYLTMKNGGLLSSDSSEWTIILFFKNLTVIPLTLVFNAVFLFYATGRIKTFSLQHSGSLAN